MSENDEYGKRNFDSVQDLSTCSSSLLIDEMSESITNPGTDSTSTRTHITDVGMDNRCIGSDNSERASKNDSLSVIKSEDDNTNLGVASENRTKQTSGDLCIGTRDNTFENSSLEVELERVAAIDINASNIDIGVKSGQSASSEAEAVDSRNKKKEKKKSSKESLCMKGSKKKEDEEESPFQGFVRTLAPEITEMIFVLLSPKDLASCSLVCRSWRDAVNTDIVWRRHCKQRGWTTMLTDWSCFQNASRHWSGVSVSNDVDYYKLSPLCTQRICFNKYAFLLKNWKERKFATFRLPFLENSLLFSGTPVCLSCDGKYIVTYDDVLKELLVWELEGEPRKVNCDLCQQIDVNNIHVAFDTIVIVQGPYISVYINTGVRFELTYIKSEFVDIDEDELSEIKIAVDVSNDYLIGCATYTNSPAYVWDRRSGDSVVSITFNSTHSLLSAVNLCGSSVYFGRQSIVNEHKVVEFDLKLNCWSSFNVDCSHSIKHLIANSEFLCVVTVENIRREYNNEVCIWNRATGTIIKSFKGCGKSYQFVNNHLIYYYNAKIIVQSVQGNSLIREMYLNDSITNLKPVFDNLVVITTVGKVELWDWMLKKRLYTAFYSNFLTPEVWVDCEKIVLQINNYREIVVLRF